jgi:hypothetical protein
VNVRKGIFTYDNSTANPVTRANIGYVVYAEDDHTVGTSKGTNGVVAGVVEDVTSDGVAISILDPQRATKVTLTSAQNATTAASDLATAIALANALKASFNALQADVVAINVGH